MKVSQVHDLQNQLEIFTNLRIYNTIKYTIIHYNIELVKFKNCTLVYNLDIKKLN
jgi:hypothetical protein